MRRNGLTAGGVRELQKRRVTDFTMTLQKGWCVISTRMPSYRLLHQAVSFGATIRIYLCIFYNMLKVENFYFWLCHGKWLMFFP